jgi:hypothetical protein
MTALLALAVAENLFVDNFSELCARSTAHRRTDQSTQQSAGKTTDCKPDRTTDKSQGSANFGATGCACHTTGCTASSTNDTTGLLGRFTRQNLVRFTARTTFKNKHGYLLQTGEQQKARLSLPKQRKAGIQNIYAIS